MFDFITKAFALYSESYRCLAYNQFFTHTSVVPLSNCFWTLRLSGFLAPRSGRDVELTRCT